MIHLINTNDTLGNVCHAALSPVQKLQFWTKYLAKIEKIKQNWRRPEKFYICFCVMFDHY